jgi:drug/metabolite transporter (DMT)-like permease
MGLGVLLALVAALCQAIFVLVSRGYGAVPTHQAMATILAGSAVLATLFSLVVAGPGAVSLPFGSPDLLTLLVVVGLLAAALPSFLFLTGIRRIGGVRTGILMLFEPVVGVALAAAFLAEAVTPLQVAGGVTILLAAALVQREGTRPDEAALVPLPGGP